MAQTVIGFFKESADAQKAVDRLQGKGISRQSIDVSTGTYKDGTADPDGRNTNRVTDFFNKLFGHDSDDAKRYSTVGQSNVTIVTVHAPSHDLAEEAADVLDDCGAIDVDEHAAQSGYSGSRTRSDSMRDVSSDRETTSLGEEQLRSGMGTEGNRWRSRIIDRSIDDDYRLRGE